jgi:hypothetical protein
MAPTSAATTLYRKDGTGDWVLAAGTGLNPDPGGPLGAIAADPAQRDRLYAIDGARLYVSTDAGETFTPIAMGWLGNPRSLTVPSAGRLLLGTSANGLYESTDDGVTWTQRLVEVQGQLAGVNDVALDSTGRTFAATEGAGLQRLEGGQGAIVGKCLLDAVVLTVAGACTSRTTAATASSPRARASASCWPASRWRRSTGSRRCSSSRRRGCSTTRRRRRSGSARATGPRRWPSAASR